MADPRFVGVLSLSPYSGPSPYTGYDATIAMSVDNDFSFIDSTRYVWTVHKGDVTDGANIPRLLKPIIGHGFQEPYMPAAVLHDIYCRSKVRSWQATHWMFREAMLTNGVNILRATYMWAAVFAFGPHW